MNNRYIEQEGDRVYLMDYTDNIVDSWKLDLARALFRELAALPGMLPDGDGTIIIAMNETELTGTPQNDFHAGWHAALKRIKEDRI